MNESNTYCYRNPKEKCELTCAAYSKVALPLKAPNTEDGAEFLSTGETHCWDLYAKSLLALSTHGTARNLGLLVNSIRLKE